MTKEKIRVYQLARELKIETKDLLELCKKAGIDAKNQLSSLEQEHRDQIEQMLKASSTKPGAGASKPVTPVLTPEMKSIPNLSGKPKPREAEPRPHAPVAELPVEEAPKPPAAPAAAPAKVEAPAAAAKVEPKAPPAPPAKPPTLGSGRMPNLSARPSTAPGPATPRPAAIPSAPPPAAPAAPKPPVAPATPAAQKPPEAKPATPEAKPPIRPTMSPPPMTPRPPLSPGAKAPPRLPGATPRPGGPSAQGPGQTPTSPREGGAGRFTGRRPGDIRPGLSSLKPLPPPSLKTIGTAPPKEKVMRPIGTFTKEQLVSDKPIRPEDVLNPKAQTAVADDAAVDIEDDDEKGKAKKAKAIPGRDNRRAARNERAEKRKAKAETTVRSGKILTPDEELHVRTIHRVKAKQLRRPGTIKPQGPIVLESPITVRSFSESVGVSLKDLMPKLMTHGLTINSNLDTSTAELLAIEFGKEIHIKRPLTAEEQALASFEKPDNPEDLVPRAPIVTIMGHVDHGKTSLLDKIRASNVAATEAGGITQVIRAWRVEHGGRPVTFLDTPGHQAFTKMRARGANVTDIAVIVVAADDGVMPQTEEAISHAKAAGVSLVVAINKVDLPAANVNRTRQQLYGHNVLPDDMGGDAPFVETSAATGKGIDELLDQLSVVAELRELKANPNKPGKGTCLEAMLSEGEGVRATLLVRDGTLKRGDVILCGHAYGRVRQMYDDLGRAIEEAGPSVPVRITGLDEVPNADDPFLVLPDLAQAREIAEARKLKVHEQSQTKKIAATVNLFTDKKVTELKIILKADFRGSVEAIRKELEKLVHDEVRVRILHVGIGGITESDVNLALASPDDTLVVGFNVTPDDEALSLAEAKGIKIREYDIIYNLTNDIKAALEGKLKPREEVIHLGRAVIRETFKISKVGTIAGCYVTQGSIKRNAKIRVIRDGVIIYPPSDRTAGLDSLKRFKDDSSEVREGFECGMKVAGYDDIKVGDVIEAFRVDQVQRTLE